MSEEKNENSVLPGLAGAGIVGGVTLWGMNRSAGTGGALKALRGDPKATPKFVAAVNELAPLPAPEVPTAATPAPAAATPAVTKRTLGEQRKMLKDLKYLTTGEARYARVAKVSAVAEAAGGGHTITLHGQGDEILHKLTGIKSLPDGLTVETALEGEKIKGLLNGEESFLAKHVAKGEKTLASEIRGAGKNFFGLRNASAGGKTGIIAATVAGVAIGAMALNAMFGGSGKHTSRVNEERANEPAAGAAARA
jgi:hypothetical protein